jgi:hypothetical protein
MLIVD